MDQTRKYRIFINGAFFNGSDVYDFAYQRGLAIALYKKLNFKNTKSPNIMDMWTNGKEKVIITKHE